MKSLIKEPEYMGRNRKGFLSLLSLLIFGALLVIGIASPELAFGGAVIKGVGVAGPNTVIIGEPGSTESIDAASPELLEAAVLEKVIQTHPSSFPLDTIAHQAAKQSTPSWEYKAYDTPYVPYYSKILTGLSAATAFASAIVTPENIEFIRKGSTIFVPSINGGDGKILALLVTHVSRSTTPTIQIMALNPVTAGYVPIIPNNTSIIIGPIAANELEMQVEQQVPVPQPYTNWNQLFMCQVEQGDYAEAHQKQVNWGWKDMHEYTVMDFRSRRSIAYYLGYGGEFVDAVNNVKKYTTSGILRQIVRQYVPPAAWNDEEFINFCQYVFIGHKGSQKKVLLAGDQLIANIAKAPILKQQNAMSTEVLWGLEFKKIVTNFGSIYMHYDPILTEMKLNGHGVVLDPEFLVRANFEGLQFTNLDLKSAGIRRVKAQSIAEASSLLLRNLEAHVWVKPN
jgi:hypothetical protein